MSEGKNTIETEVKPIAHIGTDNFVDYIIGKQSSNGEILRADFDDFEKQIEVPEEIHQAIKEMYEQKREGLLTGPTYEAQLSRMAAKTEEYAPGIGESITNIKPKTGFVEQARVVFSDLDTEKIGVTESTYGYGYEADVRPVIQEAVQQNGVPIMLIHTHPDDVFFSPEDYAMMIAKVSTENLSARLMYAGVVLLPDKQLMAVATKDTPMIRGDEINKILQEQSDEMESGRSKILQKGLEMLAKIYERRKVVEGITAIKKAVGEKYAPIVDEQAKQFNIQEGEAEELEKLSQETTKISEDRGAQFHNSELIAFAKKIGVKLYVSQDMRTFKEFSA